jgi:hypothetical protein
MTMTAFLISLVIAAIALAVWTEVRGRKRRMVTLANKQRDFIDGYTFPAALKQKLYTRFPNLSTAQIEQILEGLRQWFMLLATHRGQKFGMPSKAVDTAWHEFILMTRQYQAFCDSAFGKYLHHAPNLGGNERSSENLALARTYALAPVTAIVAGGAALGAASATGLFDIDRALGIEGGHVYDDALRTEMMKRHAASQQPGVDGGVSVSMESNPRDEQGGHGIDSGDTSSSSSSDGSGSSGGDGGGGGGCGGGGCGS